MVVSLVTKTDDSIGPILLFYGAMKVKGIYMVVWEMGVTEAVNPLVCQDSASCVASVDIDLHWVFS